MTAHLLDVTNAQVTLVQLDNYGPWTVTPAPRREADLQALQATLYADLSEQIGARDGYVFFTRFDNMIALTNGIDLDAHERIQTSIGNRYPVSVSMSVDVGRTPVDALVRASERLQAAGSAQDESRRAELLGEPIAVDERRDDDVRIAHFDVVDATRKYTDRCDAYDAFLQIERAYLSLADHLYAAHDSLAFFVGGDNVIAIGADLDEDDYAGAIDHVAASVDVELKVGVGQGATAHDAGMAAKHALEKCRDDGSRVEGPVPVPGAD